MIEIGPMDEVGGLLVFVDHKTLRLGPLHALSATRFAAGPSMGVPYPFAIEVEFLRDRAGATTGLRWHEAGRVLTVSRIAPHRTEDVSIRSGDAVLKGVLHLPSGKGPHPAVVLAHGSGDATRHVAIWNMHFLRMGLAVLSLDKRGAGTSTTTCPLRRASRRC